MDAPSGQSIQKHRKGGNNCFPLTSCHLCDFSFMKGYTTNQLNIIVNHVPGDLISASYPAVLPVSIISLYGNAFPCSRKVPVILSCRNFQHTVFLEPPCCLFHYCKCRRNTLIENLLQLIINSFFNLVNLIIYILFLINILFCFSL